MASGIRATVKFSAPEGCPLARASETTGSAIDTVSTSVSLPDSDGGVTEFLAAGDDTLAGDRPPIFSYGSASLYRITHDGRTGRCPCEVLGRYGCPVHRYLAEDGDLTLVFHAESIEQIQEVMAELRERFPSVDVQRLLQPPLRGSANERVFVNRGRLTARQLEAVRTAYEMGYFERPKGANASEVAAELGISPSTFTEHLVTGQRKLLDDVFERDP